MHAGRAQRVPRILDPPGRLVPTPLTKLAWSAYLARELAGQARFPFAAPDVVTRAQRRRIRAMARHAYRTVPHYRDVMDRLGIGPDAIETADALAQLPILEREALQQDPERLTSSAVAPRDRLTLRTGGSTGAPRAVHHSTRSIVRNAAHGERERSIIARAVGRQIGYRETVIGSPRSTAQEVQAHLRAHTLQPRGVRVERQYLSVLDPVATTAERMAEFAPHVVHGYGSYLAALFAHVRAHRADFPLPRVVTFSSDGLSDAARAMIRDELGVLVLGTYQAVEAFKIGFECERHTGIHLNFDLYPIRLVNAEGDEVPHGESGDVVVSNLINRSTVLLNYRLGDVAHMLTERCPCGRTLPLLSFIDGRIDDLIRLSSGDVVHPQVVRLIFTKEQTIWQYQVVQEEVEKFRVAIVGGREDDREAMCDRLTKRFETSFGPNVRVSFSFVDAIAPTPAGKVRPVLSLLTSNGSK